MNPIALKAPAQDWKVPAWATLHNAELAGAALVIVLLAFAVLRLSKGGKAVPPPPPAPKPSGGGMKLLLLAGLGGAGFWYWDTHLRHTPAATVKAAPAPSPTPTPTPTPHPTVTQTVAPHFTSFHFPLTGSQILIGLAVVAIVGYLMVRVVARNAS